SGIGTESAGRLRRQLLPFPPRPGNSGCISCCAAFGDACDADAPGARGLKKSQGPLSSKGSAPDHRPGSMAPTPGISWHLLCAFDLSVIGCFTVLRRL